MDLSPEFAANDVPPDAGGGDGSLPSLMNQRSWIQQQSRSSGARGEFLANIVHMLRDRGILAAPLPRSAGGQGWGTETSGAKELCSALRYLGYGSLSAGRVFEAHVNAVALIFRHGEKPVRDFAIDSVRDGHLFGLWVTPADTVRAIRRGAHRRISGEKAICSAAGIATRAVITAVTEQNDEQMIAIDATLAQPGCGAGARLHGMNNTATGPMRFELETPAEWMVGKPGDYLREPDFSVGAWRTSAVTVGGLMALVDEAVRQLRRRDRHTDPHQAARIGQMLIHAQTAAMWIRSVAERLAGPEHEHSHMIGHVNLARLAIERACLEVIPLVQRSLGLQALIASNPLEAMMRDLATYLRQPAGDTILTEAAITFAEMPEPAAFGEPS